MREIKRILSRLWYRLGCFVARKIFGLELSGDCEPGPLQPGDIESVLGVNGYQRGPSMRVTATGSTSNWEVVKLKQ